MSKVLLGVVAVCAGLLFVAPASSAADRVVIQRGAPVEIAFANDLTGFASGFGAGFANAVQMAVEAHPAIRGFPIHINVVDAPCGDPIADAAAATSIVANTRNVAVIGQLCSAGFEQPLAIFESAGIVVVSGSATADGLPSLAPTVFNRTAVSNGDGFESWYGAVSALPSDIAWHDAYAIEFGAAAPPLADLYYDATGLLIRSLQKISIMEGPNLVIDRAALANAVRQTSKYDGVTCRVSLDARTGNRFNEPTALSRCAEGD